MKKNWVFVFSLLVLFSFTSTLSWSHTSEETASKPRLAYIYLLANDVKTMKEFYGDILGLKVSGYNQWFLSLDANGMEVLVFKGDYELPIQNKWAWQPGYEAGSGHITSYSIQISEQNYQQIVQNIIDQKVESLKPVPEWRRGSYWGITVKDPMGNTVEVWMTPRENPTTTTWIEYIKTDSNSLADNSPQFAIDRTVWDNGDIEFIPHHGTGVFSNYVTMEVNFPPIKNLFDKVNDYKEQKLKNRGEAHITVITPPEYNQVLSKVLNMDQIDQVAKNLDIQKARFQIECVGLAKADISGNTEEAYYVVVKSESLLEIRKAIFKLYVEKGGEPSHFDPNNWYPHITLGFTKSDLHEGPHKVKKGPNSCFANLSVN